MNQESRVLLAIVLSVLIFVGYYQFFEPPVPVQAPVAESKNNATDKTQSVAVSQKRDDAPAIIQAPSFEDTSFQGEDKTLSFERALTPFKLSFIA